MKNMPKNRTVLIVDDSKFVQHIIKKSLDKIGINSIFADNGKSALKIMDDKIYLPDLILCDIFMPEMDGYDFKRALNGNSLYSLVPFIFLTGKSDPRNLEYEKLARFTEYITKPFDEENFLSKIQGILKI
jgi:CheY-like chemotaxis protein